MKTPAILKVEGLTVKQGKRVLLEDLCFTVANKEFVGVIGENGCGKSSLLAHLSGTDDTANTQVRMNNRLLNSYDPKEMACQRAVMQQITTAPFGFLVEEILLLGRSRYKESTANALALINDVAQLLDIRHLIPRNIQTLSGGERQRVFLAKTILQLLNVGTRLHIADFTGKLLLLDEPTSALDIRHQKAVMVALQSLKQAGLAIICVSHDINLITPYCDTILLLANGGCLVKGPPKAVLTQHYLTQCFQTEIAVLYREDGSHFISF
ncbi:ATP-binding cassette domain-containing protein [Alteromonas pelagimontana]|uniref:ATP-binding cassette domain-containing protein n=1 Tax=Alteromonas pelagimontana TaxID=1858656 RepID=A0A6M4MBR8_9ALTE|nr:ATP-binding cassette domain-containing protein [Alteromonas pelagimontana]QJR80652.1 ATP-binding cassette domain-containing protein [Alteromonas pelagimontana]